MKNRKDADYIRDVYNTHGKQYHESRTSGTGRLTNEHIDMPATMSLLPEDLSSVHVLDAGCGSGVYARALAKAGAQVTAVDVSDVMIDLARKDTDPQATIEYSMSSLYELDFADQTFDAIISTYVLENVEKIDVVLKHFYRLLKPGGIVVCSMSHPLRAQSQKEERDGKQVWVLQNYFDHSERISDFGNGMKVKKYKRTIEDYIAEGIEAGFIVDGLREPQPIASGQQVDADGFKTASRLPYVLTLRFRKQ
jgi:ubiquinone/menaquinone biosynthesis C-methylase UbiE